MLTGSILSRANIVRSETAAEAAPAEAAAEAAPEEAKEEKVRRSINLSLYR